MNNWLKKLHPGHSLRAQISLATGAMVMLLSVAIGYYAADISRSQIEHTEGEAFALRAKNALDVLDRGMFERSREIQNAAILDDIRDPRVSLAHKREMLERLQTIFNAYAWIGICDAQGKGMVGTGQYLEGKDLSKRPWCDKGRDGIYFGDVHDALLLAKLLPQSQRRIFLSGGCGRAGQKQPGCVAGRAVRAYLLALGGRGARQQADARQGHLSGE